jgi:hypothetical protein
LNVFLFFLNLVNNSNNIFNSKKLSKIFIKHLVKTNEILTDDQYNENFVHLINTFHLFIINYDKIFEYDNNLFDFLN